MLLQSDYYSHRHFCNSISIFRIRVSDLIATLINNAFTPDSTLNISWVAHAMKYLQRHPEPRLTFTSPTVNRIRDRWLSRYDGHEGRHAHTKRDVSAGLSPPI